MFLREFMRIVLKNSHVNLGRLSHGGSIGSTKANYEILCDISCACLRKGATIP